MCELDQIILAFGMCKYTRNNPYFIGLLSFWGFNEPRVNPRLILTKYYHRRMVVHAMNKDYMDDIVRGHYASQ